MAPWPRPEMEEGGPTRRRIRVAGEQSHVKKKEEDQGKVQSWAQGPIALDYAIMDLGSD